MWASIFLRTVSQICDGGALMERLAMTVKETAGAMGVSESTVYWMCYQNELPHNRVKARGCKGKGKILISKQAIEKWLKGGTGEQN